MYNLKKLYDSAIFQGKGKSAPYFEGWYVKVEAASGKTVAFIPGISLSNEDSHSFIQLIYSENAQTRYNKFPLESFEYSNDTFEISVDKNHFSIDGFWAEIEGDIKVTANVTFKDRIFYPKRFFSPGIMGPFSFVPFMECNHGVVMVKAKTIGFIQIDDQFISLDKGTAYIEKDWGCSFPDPYLWIQSANFSNSDASFMLSAARIPFMGSKFNGLIGFLYYNNVFHHFASYSSAHLSTISLENDTIVLTVKELKSVLKVIVKSDKAGVLKAPVKGKMSREIKECVNAQIHVMLTHENAIVFEGIAENAAVEFSGEYLNLYIT
jgi:tocopherol cyclase